MRIAGSMCPWLADRLILRPTWHQIPSESQRHWIEWKKGQFESWIQRPACGQQPELFVLKFPGTGGRAERSTSHPADAWPNLPTEVWTINPPGYGGSPGRASLAHMAPVAEAAWTSIQLVATGRPVLVTGNSLGSMSALYLAARFPVADLLIRNPVPLCELILARYGRLAVFVARQIPRGLCPIANAARARAPAVFVTSGLDQVVPPALQQQVISQYAGPARILRLAEADHADPPNEDELAEYMTLLGWLREQALEKAAQGRG